MRGPRPDIQDRCLLISDLLRRATVELDLLVDETLVPPDEMGVQAVNDLGVILRDADMFVRRFREAVALTGVPVGERDQR